MLRVDPTSDVKDCVFDVRDNASVMVGKNCVLRGKVVAMPGCRVEIGDDTVWNRRCFVRASEGRTISIGNGCLFSDVVIETSDLHSVVSVETGERLNPAQDVTIKDRCWLGSGVIMLPGSSLSSDTVVGARSVVTSNFPSNVVVAGAPARVVKENVSWRRERI